MKHIVPYVLRLLKLDIDTEILCELNRGMILIPRAVPLTESLIQTFSVGVPRVNNEPCERNLVFLESVAEGLEMSPHHRVILKITNKVG